MVYYDQDILLMAIEGYKRRVEELEEKTKIVHRGDMRDLEYAEKFIAAGEVSIWQWYDPRESVDKNYDLFQKGLEIYRSTGMNPSRIDVMLALERDDTASIKETQDAETEKVE